MNRANPSDLRDALMMAQSMIKAGILFVPIPILSAEDAQHLGALAHKRLHQIEQEAKKSP
ncbi:DUF1382 family protein [Pseudomonas typographi]|nr:DUF1382 family protein [Pseudomonas typographi]MBD1554271.1 DUF1382 family protein [Pseudomonas typographi]MBD1589502.1 DUF1382 family protein [Pseudomonas typographi]